MSILRKLLNHTETVRRTGDTDTVRKIVSSLDRLDPGHARYIAAFAYILGRIALADRVVSDAETGTMERLVMEHGRLPEEHAIIVVQMAKHQNLLFGGTEDFLVTREFAGIATTEQKLTLLDCLFAVSSAGSCIAAVEDNEIRRVAVELKIPHDDYVRVRLAYRRYLGALKDQGEQ
ncbi:MAG: TerB family tellurite resistance protein [Vicinamibacterales bacterium]